MKQYIDKAAVVEQANIEITACRLAAQQGILTEFGKGKLEGLEGIVDFLDTLEVKEVDLEKGVKDYIYALPHSRTGVPGGWKCSWSEEEVIKIVRHFFELGVKSEGE